MLEQGLASGMEYQTVKVAFNSQQNAEAIKDTIKNAFEMPNPLKRVVSIGIYCSR